MKNITKYFALICVALGMASCVQDLDTKPIDPNSSTSFNADRMFTKCYSCMAVIGIPCLSSALLSARPIAATSSRQRHWHHSALSYTAT